eukprot:1156671-Pelagomonas_calceolata.AAC.7
MESDSCHSSDLCANCPKEEQRKSLCDRSCIKATIDAAVPKTCSACIDTQWLSGSYTPRVTECSTTEQQLCNPSLCTQLYSLTATVLEPSGPEHLRARVV